MTKEMSGTECHMSKLVAAPRALLLLAALAVVAGLSSIASQAVAAGTVTVVHPQEASIPVGDTQTFTAWTCPSDDDGRPLTGDDMIPGSDDDECTSVNVSWSVSPPIGSFSSTTGSSTMFTAAIVGGAGISANTGEQIGSTSVFVVAAEDPGGEDPPPSGNARLVFLDFVDQETDEALVLRLGYVRAVFLASLTSQIARREALGREATRGELRLLRRLITSDYRARLVARDFPAGPGGAILATISSFSPAGSLLDEVQVLLEPMGTDELRMVPHVVVVDPDTREPFRNPVGGGGFGPFTTIFTIPDEADGVVFITGVSGGMLVATSPDLDDATVDLFEQ